MRKLILATMISGLILCLGACDAGTSKKNKTNSSADKKRTKYYCTMHPEVTSEQPGVCSKCGMDLVEREHTENK